MSVRRRIVREKVVQALYANEMTRDGAAHVIEHILPSLKDDKSAYEFAKKLVMKTIDHAAEIDEIIISKVTNWDFSRIALLDRLILRMAICELVHFQDIPPKVSMNEAIEIAKLFSTEKSGQFVNGVLDAVFEDLKMSGGMSKLGRGLFDGEPKGSSPASSRPRTRQSKP